MTILFFAQPYDISAQGFYFSDMEEYQEHSSRLVNRYGEPVEELEIQFIDGEDVDSALARTWCLSQVNISQFIDAALKWDDDQKIRFIIAVGECSYDHDQFVENPDNVDIDIHFLVSMKELAECFVGEGLFGDIPEHLQYYIDYEAIARDLSVEYCETEIAGQRIIYRCS
jgi:antirestriction protein